MKMEKLMLAAVVGALLMAPIVRAEEEGEEAEAGEAMSIPDTLPGIWEEINELRTVLHDTVKAGQLADVHKKAFAIRDLVNALPSYTSDLLSTNSLPKLTTWVEGIASSAGKLDEMGDAADQSGTEKELKRFDTMLSSIAKLFPASVTETQMYTCTMHPEVMMGEPGDCPKCKMKLVKYQEESEKK